MIEQRVATGSEQDQPVPLMQALGIAIAKFEQAPRAREQGDYPYMVAYFRGENGLVMLRRILPVRYVFEPVETHLDGYFAEAFDVDEHGHVNVGVSGPSVLNGSFRRIDVTDESDDPYHKIGLTPTRFPSISREFFGKRFQNQPQALPGTTDEEAGTLGQLFAQQQIKDVDRSLSDEARRSLREVIIGRYFREPKQGFSKRVGNEHFVITEDEQSPLIVASRALGVKTHIVKINENWWNDPYSFEKLRDAQALLPMLISFDYPSFELSQREDLPERPDVLVSNLASGYSDRVPLFAYVDFTRDDRDETKVTRRGSGVYQVQGEDSEVFKNLLMKVGLDYLLTTKVRQLAQGLG